MKKICLVYGGDSLENEISILTALKVATELEKYSYSYLLVYISRNGEMFTGSSLKDKDLYNSKKGFKKGTFIKNKKCYFKSGINKYEFDIVLLLSHGKGAEDGTHKGYFDTLKIPCIAPSVNASSLLQNKLFFKQVLKDLNVPQVKYYHIKKEEYLNGLNLKLKYPLIVKPVSLGSSIGVCKVENETNLNYALDEVFLYENEALIEEMVCSLKEVNIAIFRHKNQLIKSLAERVNDKDKVLSFLDKYDNYTLSDTHIIPADVDEDIIIKINNISENVYNKLNLNSVVRFDYLLDEKNKELYLNEINAIPGSLAYYLYEKLDISLIDIVEKLIEDYYYNQKKDNLLYKKYDEYFLTSLKAK